MSLALNILSLFINIQMKEIKNEPKYLRYYVLLVGLFEQNDHYNLITGKKRLC